MPMCFEQACIVYLKHRKSNYPRVAFQGDLRSDSRPRQPPYKPWLRWPSPPPPTVAVICVEAKAGYLPPLSLSLPPFFPSFFSWSWVVGGSQSGTGMVDSGCCTLDPTSLGVNLCAPGCGRRMTLPAADACGGSVGPVARLAVVRSAACSSPWWCGPG